MIAFKYNPKLTTFSNFRHHPKHISDPPKTVTNSTRVYYQLLFFAIHYVVLMYFYLSSHSSMKLFCMYNTTTYCYFNNVIICHCMLIIINFHIFTAIYFHTWGARQGEHAAKLIGWGTTHKVKYWILMNSFGPFWGCNGTFKVLRTNNKNFEFAYAIVAPSVNSGGSKISTTFFWLSHFMFYTINFKYFLNI